jgi:tripartite-type tricarboxylate transporter receptor subunit TctC
MQRSTFVSLSLVMLIAFSTANAADIYPTKPVRVVVPFAPGGINDVLARILSQKLTENLGATIVIDNRGGAGGTLGSNIVAHAAPDGYTLLFSSSSTIAVSPSMYSNLPYDPVQDFSAIAQVASVGSVLVVHPTIPANTVKELIAYAKANPGKLNYGSAGAGASQHLASELFKTMAGINMVHVPYKGGGPAMADLLAGQISLMIELLPTALPQIKGGKIRALAVSIPKRSPVLPDLPTIAETLPGYDLTIWTGMLAPGGTPKEIVQRLSVAVLAVLKSPDMRERLASQGAEPVGDTPAEFSAYIKKEIARWAVVVKASGARAE